MSHESSPVEVCSLMINDCRNSIGLTRALGSQRALSLTFRRRCCWASCVPAAHFPDLWLPQLQPASHYEPDDLHHLAIAFAMSHLPLDRRGQGAYQRAAARLSVTGKRQFVLM